MTQAFNLSQLANNVNTSGQLNAAAGLYNQLPVANGGTGVATVATGAILVGAGTAAMTAVPAATTGNVLTANGTTWASAASAGGPAPVVRIYTSPSPWTKPATLKGVNITLVSGGGSGGAGGSSPTSQASGGGGGGGGYGYISAPSIPGPVTVTVGSGGTAAVSTTGVVGNSGGASSFGALISATGGAGGAGVNASGALGGAGGSITNSATVFGAPGKPGDSASITTSSNGGASWNSWGWGGTKISPTDPAPLRVSALGYGGGGGGAFNAATNTSGAGTSGFVIVEEFY